MEHTDCGHDGYPLLQVDCGKIERNARRISDRCASRGIEVWGVTKGTAGDPRVARAMLDGGCKGILDSRLTNITGLRSSGIDGKIGLLRVAMLSEVREMIKYADLSMQSELRTIISVDTAAYEAGITHDVLIMVDAGDLREGFWPDEIPSAAKALKALRGGVRLVGVAANFACATGVLPTRRKLDELVECRDLLARVTAHDMPYVCVGGTCCLPLIESGDVPPEVNMVRVGEAILLGTDTANSLSLDHLEQDAMVLRAEVIECRTKPSAPHGPMGAAAGGVRPTFDDRGRRRRAILAIGKQDVMPDKLVPLDRGASIVTASGDHMIVDVTDAEAERGSEYRSGDVLSFRPRYGAMLSLSTSRYVQKVHIGGNEIGTDGKS